MYKIYSKAQLKWNIINSHNWHKLNDYVRNFESMKNTHTYNIQVAAAMAMMRHIYVELEFAARYNLL
jgi:hypothetical protein